MLKFMMWKNKICLGTAQFGDIYGITNKNKKQINVNEVKKFLLLLKKNKINFIDTALSYKNVDKKLSETNIKLNNFNIITKISKPNEKKSYENMVLKKILESKKRFGIKSFYAVLLHDCHNIKFKDILKIKTAFNLLKKNKLTKKIGISIYNIEELNYILKFFVPDIIQVPLNMFDKRFIRKKILNKLSKYKIEIHARSIFLQGLLLVNPETLKKKFSPWKKLFLRWHNYCNKYQINKLQAASNFIFKKKEIKKIVVGFNSVNEFNEFLSLNAKKYKNIPHLEVKQQKNIDKLINPYNWKP